MPPRIDGDKLIQHMMNKTVLSGGCWIWQGKINNMGYPVAGSRIYREYAHRLMYRLLREPIPEGLTIDHLCRTPACVNPSHLEPVTMNENTKRGRSPSNLRIGARYCIRGHEFTPENTAHYDGHRKCKACGRIISRARYSRVRDHLMGGKG
ncbi:MAG: HNH endonuclease signature motif containing protein [Candidatus Paceibacterota bacterium]|jgi:hypothetical protein